MVILLRPAIKDELILFVDDLLSAVLEIVNFECLLFLKSELREEFGPLLIAHLRVLVELVFSLSLRIDLRLAILWIFPHAYQAM